MGYKKTGFKDFEWTRLAQELLNDMLYYYIFRVHCWDNNQ